MPHSHLFMMRMAMPSLTRQNRCRRPRQWTAKVNTLLMTIIWYYEDNSDIPSLQVNVTVVISRPVYTSVRHLLQLNSLALSSTDIIKKTMISCPHPDDPVTAMPLISATQKQLLARPQNHLPVPRFLSSNISTQKEQAKTAFQTTKSKPHH